MFDGSVHPSSGKKDIGAGTPYQDESFQEFWKHMEHNDKKDPYVKKFWEVLQNQMTTIINENIKKNKETAEKYRRVSEGETE